METDSSKLEKTLKDYKTTLKELNKLIEKKRASHSRSHMNIVQHLFSRLRSFYQHRQEHPKQVEPKTKHTNDTTEPPEPDALEDCILMVLITRGNLQTLLTSNGGTSLQIIKQIKKLDSNLVVRQANFAGSNSRIKPSKFVPCIRSFKAPVYSCSF